MPRIAIAIVLLIAAIPAAAHAQSADVATAKAHADAVIARSGASDWFVNITTSDQPTVRHIRSGMTCEFVGMDDQDTIRIYPQVANGPAPGDDVSCGTWIGRTFVTVYATRYPQSYSSEDVFQSALAQLTRNWPQARPATGPFEILLLDGQAQPLMAVFDVELEGRPSRSVVLLEQRGEWSFKARATGPGDDDTAVEFGSMQFALSLPGGLETAMAAGAGD